MQVLKVEANEARIPQTKILNTMVMTLLTFTNVKLKMLNLYCNTFIFNVHVSVQGISLNSSFNVTVSVVMDGLLNVCLLFRLSDVEILVMDLLLSHSSPSALFSCTLFLYITSGHLH